MAQGVAFLLVFENILQFFGALIGLSIATIAIKGYQRTRSPTLLRLSLAFLLLFVSFMAEALVGLNALGILPQLAFLISVLISMAAFFEAAGYFFLALSHMINVRTTTGIRVAPFLALPLVNLPAALQSLSLFFLLYGAIETGISYFKMRKAETLLIAFGLCFIAVGMLLSWTSLLSQLSMTLLLLSLCFKIIGLSTLFLPVLKFSMASGGYKE